MKKLFVALVLTPLISLADTEVVDGITWTYTVSDGKAQIGTGDYGSPTISSATIGAITIPSRLGGCPVAVIGDYAFYYCNKLTSVVIPEGVTNIGNYAFYYCNGLTSVKISPSAKSIGSCAFSHCGSLTSVTIPSSVTNIGDGAFGSCYRLNAMTIPSGVTSIGSGAFGDCSELNMITIPKSVMRIGPYAFSGTKLWNEAQRGAVIIGDCLVGSKSYNPVGEFTIPAGVRLIADRTYEMIPDMTSVKISDGVRFIGAGAFRKCPRLKTVTLSSSVESIGESAFRDCESLLQLKIPDGVKTIGAFAFDNCKNLSSLTIPASVDKIGWAAFEYCSGLASLTIMEGIKDIGSDAFASCRSLQSVTLPNSVTNLGTGVFSLCSGLTSVVIPNSVTTIADSAFASCVKLAAIKIPPSVTSIGNSAFEYCKELVEVEISSSVERIGAAAFQGCSGMTSISIPANVTSVESSVFAGCKGLKSVDIPSSVTNIGYQAFRGCSGLMSLSTPLNLKSIGSEAFYGCSGLTRVEISEEVTDIGYRAFYGCSNLGDGVVVVDNCVLCVNGVCPSLVDLPQGVRLIAGGAFFDCGGLESITLPLGLLSIGDSAFSNCGSLTSVKIPESVLNIGNGAFSRCSSLKHVMIPSGVTSIGGSVFSDCSGLLSVVMPDSVTSIGSYAFRNCGDLTVIDLPSRLVDIGDNAFEGCTELKSVSIPSCVSNIGNSAFSECSGLTSVTMPLGVTNIGYRAFYHCSALTSVTIPTGVMSIGSQAFESAALTSVTIPSSVTSIWYDAFHYCSSISIVFVDGEPQECVKRCFGDRMWYQKIGEPIDYEWNCECRGNDAVVKWVRPAYGDIVIPLTYDGHCVTGIGDWAFSGCGALLSVTIPLSITNIGEYAFANCNNLISLEVDDANPVYCSDGGVLYDKSLAVLVACSGGRSGHVVIPDGVTQVAAGAFSGCRGLNSLTMPECLTDIGEQAFYDCANLKTVYVGVGAAQRCSDLMSLSGLDVSAIEFVELMPYSIAYEGTKGVANPNPTTYTVTNEIVFAALADTEEYWFRGWEPAKIEVGTTGDLVVTAKWDRIQGVAEAAGDQNREWVSSGDADWFVTWNDEKGKYVVRSGEIGNSQTSVLETVVMNGGTVSFAVATSCEPLYRGKIRTDGLSFHVDGNEVLWLDGESGWTNVLWSVTGEGAHRLQWKYGKDIEGASGRDCAFLSEFTFYHEVVVSFSGGDATEGDVPRPIFSYNGAEITLPPLGTLQNPRHAFVGWSDGETVYQPGDRFLLGDVAPVFTAQWVAKRLSAPVISVPPFYTTEKTTVTISAEAGAEVRYTLDGSDPTMASAAYAGPFEIAGSMTVRAAAFREDWFDSPVVSATTVRAPWTYGECLNGETLNFTSEGAGEWVRDLSVTHDGIAALCSGAIGNNATSRLELVVFGGGELTFWWRASTEVYRGKPMDSGVLVVDGEDVAEIYGEADWARKTVVLSGGGLHTIRWEFRKDEEDDPLTVGDDCVWLDEVKWTSFGPSVVNDSGATVTGDAETGFVVAPSKDIENVEICLNGIDPSRVTVKVSVGVKTVAAHGAMVKIVSEGADITEFLNVPAADGNGVVDLTKAMVKEEIVKEVLDVEKGAKVELNAADPKLKTAPTRVGLFYQLREGGTLGGMKDGDSKVGDGEAWTPNITVKGGNSAFYSIGVGKGE